MMTRREMFAPLAAMTAAPAAALAAARSAPLAAEGRRLAAEYFNACRAWASHQESYDRTFPAEAPDEVYDRWEERGDDACGRWVDAQRRLTAFVVKAGGRATASGAVTDYHTAELDVLPAHAALIDGVLWIAHQDADGSPGDLLLTHVAMGDVADLGGSKRGGR
jgi:putative intracellular protease/amidase